MELLNSNVTFRATVCSNSRRQPVKCRVEWMVVYDWFSPRVAANNCTESCIVYCIVALRCSNNSPTTPRIIHLNEYATKDQTEKPSISFPRDWFLSA